MPTTHLSKPIKTTPTPLDIGEVPITYGKPKRTPNPDQIPLAYDPSEGRLWVYISEMWVPGVKTKEEVNLKNLDNLGNVVRIPVEYEAGNQVVEGYITLKELKRILNKVSE